MLIPSIPTPFPLRWGFTTKLDDPENHPPRRLQQVHGTLIHEASNGIQEGDGLWTMEPGLAIGVRVADCNPVLLAGLIHDRPWVAALHAGWRSAVGHSDNGHAPGILRQAISIFLEFGGRPHDLVWALGPAIQQCHFEVGLDVIEAARKDPAWSNDLLSEGPRGRPHLDLCGFLKAQAIHLGLDPNKDGSMPRCTFCEPDLFFSYRRGDREGRQWGWIQIL